MTIRIMINGVVVSIDGEGSLLDSVEEVQFVFSSPKESLQPKKL